MRYFLAALFCLFAVNAWAAPFVVSDPYPTSGTIPDGFTVSVDDGPIVQSPLAAVPGGQGFKFDVGSLTGGSHTLKVKAVKDFGVPWGVKYSDEAVFTFPVPVAPSGPSGLKLSP